MRARLLLAVACAYLPVSGAVPPAVLDSAAHPGGQGFAEALEPRVFEFPRDHGSHPAFRQEWWYLTGNLDTTDGQRFGFEVTFFRVALVPPPAVPVASSLASGAASAWRAREIYVAHFAVTDVSRRRYRSVTGVAR